jgi:hypothetical protein
MTLPFFLQSFYATKWRFERPLPLNRASTVQTGLIAGASPIAGQGV